MLRSIVFATCLALSAVGAPLHAGTVVVSTNISTSTTWTADNVYDLATQIYVRDGATLTIEAGTLVASTPTGNGAGSLAITRGSRIIAKGTKNAPIIFTSTNDDFTNWQELANQWGNITIMGNAFISNSFRPGNSSTCDPANVSPMEGLIEGFPGDPRVLYGGGDDDDNSGCLSYVSLRYGGRVIGLANELNGLSLGGVGRGTEINHIEIMNNVDDGIEIWGGTVYLKYVSIWNVGDDSFDVDQGWRGCAQFGLIVQGYSLDASQGSGVGDNCFETDGAEDSDAQPVTTASIYNFTVIGQPIDGDGGTAWRDNAKVQYRQCIFMDLGERLVRFDNIDGDGSSGYGQNGTASWEACWNTPYTVTSPINPCPDPASIYTAQSQGNAPGQGFLIEITDSVFFNNNAPGAYTESDARGVTLAGGSNPATSNVVATESPILCIERAPAVILGGLVMVRVTGLDPRPQNDALVADGTPPADSDFFSPATYRGGFAPDSNWICEWTAAWQYGFIKTPIEECCPAEEPNNCPWDCAPDGGNGTVNIDDLLRVINEFGQPGGACDNAPDNGDGTFGNGIVNIDDLLGIINNFGDCPDCVPVPIIELPQMGETVLEFGTFSISDAAGCASKSTIDRVEFQYSTNGGVDWFVAAVASDVFNTPEIGDTASWNGTWDLGDLPGGIVELRAVMFPESGGSVVSETVLIVHDEKPTVVQPGAFEGPDQATFDVIFDAIGSSDPEGPVADFIWNFGDGTIIETPDPNPTHIYPEPGCYHGNVGAIDAAGNASFSYFKVTVPPDPNAPPLIVAETKCECTSIEVRTAGAALGPDAMAGGAAWPKFAGFDGATLGPGNLNPCNALVGGERQWSRYAFEVVVEVCGDPNLCDEIQLIRRTAIEKDTTQLECEGRGGLWNADNDCCSYIKNVCGPAQFDLDFDGMNDIDLAAGQKIFFPAGDSADDWASDGYTAPYAAKSHFANKIIWVDAPGIRNMADGSSYNADFVAVIKGTDGKFCYCTYNVFNQKLMGVDNETFTPMPADCTTGAMTLPTGVPD